jgi:hypothetical protein
MPRKSVTVITDIEDLADIQSINDIRSITLNESTPCIQAVDEDAISFSSRAPYVQSEPLWAVQSFIPI